MLEPADQPRPFPTPPPSPDWRSLHLWQIQPVRDGLVIAAAIGLVWLGSRLSIVTVPLLLAMLLAYLFEPLVERVTQRGKVTRKGAAIGIILLIAGVVVVPAAIGATFGVSQGIRFVTSTVNRIEAVMASVAKPEDDELRAKTGRGAWLKLRDSIVEHKKTSEARGGGPLPPRPSPDTVDPNAPPPETAPQVER